MQAHMAAGIKGESESHLRSSQALVEREELRLAVYRTALIFNLT